MVSDPVTSAVRGREAADADGWYRSVISRDGYARPRTGE
jgi:hypothetical protein